MAVLPLIKVGALIVKSVSKPIAKKIKNSAVKNPRVQSLMINCARLWHRGETRMQVFVGERQKGSQRKELNERAAIELGAELASEGFLLIVAIALLAFEATRNNAKEKDKKQEMEQRLKNMERAIEQHQMELNYWRRLNGESHLWPSPSSSLPLTMNATTTTMTIGTANDEQGSVITIDGHNNGSQGEVITHRGWKRHHRGSSSGGGGGLLEEKINTLVGSGLASNILDLSSEVSALSGASTSLQQQPQQQPSPQ